MALITSGCAPFRVFRHYAPPQDGGGESALAVDGFVRFIKVWHRH